MKLNLREACYTGIPSKTKQLEKTEEHKKLVQEANMKIQKGRLNYAKAYESAKDYYK